MAFSDNLLENVLLIVILSLFLIIHSHENFSKLPKTFQKYINYTSSKFIIIFVILCLSTSNYNTSLVISIVYLLSLNMVNNSNESFENGSPVADCRVYIKSDEKKLGTKFYPLNGKGDDLKLDY